MSDDAHDPGETVGLVVERRCAVAVLRLDRRNARNALTPALVGALGAAVVAADDEPDVRVIVLTGSGTEAFCAGMDLRSFAGGRFASGTIPRIPLNLVLLKGVHVLGFQFRDFATHAPDDLRRNEGELDALLAAGRVVPYIGASFALDETAAALRHVADGQAIGKVVIDVSGA